MRRIILTTVSGYSKVAPYTQINDGHGNCLSQLASYSSQFNTGRVSRAILRLQNGIIFPCNYRKYCTKAGKIVVLFNCESAKNN